METARMQSLLAALGARLAPPPVARRLAAAGLPAGLEVLYAVTDGAELPLLGWRIRPLQALSNDGVFTDAGHRFVDGRVELDDASFESVEAFLEDAIAGAEWARMPSVRNQEQVQVQVQVQVQGQDQDQDQDQEQEQEQEQEQRTATPTILLPDLLTRVCRLVELHGYRAILTGAPHELRIQGELGGSWYSIEPWLGRDEPGLAERIAERFVRRECARDQRWSVRCDDHALRTADLGEVVRWASRPWRALRVGCDVAEVSLGLYRDDPDHLVSFEWHGGRWQARAPLTNWQVRATIEHLLLRRDKWPGLDWSLMRQPPS